MNRHPDFAAIGQRAAALHSQEVAQGDGAALVLVCFLALVAIVSLAVGMADGWSL